VGSQQRGRLPGITEPFEDAIEVAEQSQSEALESDLAGSQEVYPGRLRNAGENELLLSRRAAIDDLALQIAQGPLYPSRKRAHFRAQRGSRIGRSIEIDAVALLGKRTL
jgi:hypothetical protein